MKKVYSNKIVVYMSIFGIVLMAIFMSYSIISLISGVLNGENNIAVVYGILTVGFCLFLIIFLFVLNRLGYKVIYDNDKKVIYRKGFICGYLYELKIEDIKEVIIVTFPMEADFYVLVDTVNMKYDGGSKNSFIRIEKKKENYDFIKQFWDKPITIHRKYADLFK